MAGWYVFWRKLIELFSFQADTKDLVLRHIEEDDRLWRKKARRRERRAAKQAEQDGEQRAEQGAAAKDSQEYETAFAEPQEVVEDEEQDPLLKARRPKPGFY